MREDDRDRISRDGTKAWQYLKKDKNWHYWLIVGEALRVGREWAMNQAMTNRPEGKAYNTAFSEWLQKYKLDEMDKGDRSRLFSVMDNLPMIEQWRSTLTTTERLKLNHPNAVLRKWKVYIEPEKPKDDETRPTLRDSVANLEEALQERDKIIVARDAHIAELEAARETADHGGLLDAACRVINDLTRNKSDEWLTERLGQELFGRCKQLRKHNAAA
jgi:hypothetical protein